MGRLSAGDSNGRTVCHLHLSAARPRKMYTDVWWSVILSHLLDNDCEVDFPTVGGGQPLLYTPIIWVWLPDLPPRRWWRVGRPARWRQHIIMLPPVQPFCRHNFPSQLSSIAAASVTFHLSVTICHVHCRHISVSYRYRLTAKNR